MLKDNIEIFKHEEFGEIRVAIIDGEPWFVGRDVAEILGYARARNAIAAHVDMEDKRSMPVQIDYGGIQQMTIINEPGLYSLILSCKLPVGKEIKRWIVTEVLPVIRKTGRRVSNADLMINTYFSDMSVEHKVLVKELLVNIEKQNKKIATLNNENDLLAQKSLEWADRSLINSLVRAYGISIGNNFGKAWNDYKEDLLFKHGIDLSARITNYLNATQKRTKPRTLDMLDDSELPNAISTAVSLCRGNNVDIEELLNNKAN